MYYNFYLQIFFLTFIKSIMPFIKKDILNQYSIIEEIIINTSGLLFFSLIFYLVIQKHKLNNLFSKIIINKNYSSYKLIIFNIMLILSLLIIGKIIKNENIIRFTPYKQGLTLLFISIITWLFFSKQLNYFNILGIILVIIGLFLVDFNKYNSLQS